VVVEIASMPVDRRARRKYGEPIVPVCLPAKRAGEVATLIGKAKRKMPLFLVDKIKQSAMIEP
jgi:hypothetical protein